MDETRNDHVLVVLHSVLTDHGVISAAEQLVAGNAVLHTVRVVPRGSPFTHALSTSRTFGDPLRVVADEDEVAPTLLALGREQKATLLALGDPPRGSRKPGVVRRTLARLLAAASVPVLYVPAEANPPRDQLRRILLVLHAPYPAFDVLAAAVPIARRTHAEVLILALPSAAPLIPDAPSLGRPSLVFAPFDPISWLERECGKRGCRTRPVAGEGNPADLILRQAASLEADLVIGGPGLADLRVGWRRRRVVDLLSSRLTCPLLFSRCA